MTSTLDYRHLDRTDTTDRMLGDPDHRSAAVPMHMVAPGPVWSTGPVYRSPADTEWPQPVRQVQPPALTQLPALTQPPALMQAPRPVATNDQRDDRTPQRLDWGRYWTGTALTMFVVALLGLIAMILVQGVFRQNVFMDVDGTVALSAGMYALASAALAGVASLVFVGVMFLAPRPGLYFGWIGALTTILALVAPFTTGAALSSQVILAVINGVVGAVIVLLVPLAAVTRTRSTT